MSPLPARQDVTPFLQFREARFYAPTSFARIPSALPLIVLFPLLKPVFRSHLCDEIQVVVQIRVDTAEAIKEHAVGALITHPAPIQPLVLNTSPDLTSGIPSALPTRWTAQLLDLA